MGRDPSDIIIKKIDIAAIEVQLTSVHLNVGNVGEILSVSITNFREKKQLTRLSVRNFLWTVLSISISYLLKIKELQTIDISYTVRKANLLVYLKEKFGKLALSTVYNSVQNSVLAVILKKFLLISYHKILIAFKWVNHMPEKKLSIFRQRNIICNICYH